MLCYLCDRKVFEADTFMYCPMVSSNTGTKLIIILGSELTGKIELTAIQCECVSVCVCVCVCACVCAVQLKKNLSVKHVKAFKSYDANVAARACI